MKREEDNRDFSHTCVFEHQLKYPSLKDDLFIIEMSSSKKAIYKRELADKVFYNGTGQHDYDFKFIRYVESDELHHETRIGPCSGDSYDYYELLKDTKDAN